MSKNISILAIDLGASSGRVIQGTYNGHSIEMTTIHRFPNIPLNQNGHLYWDISTLLSEIKTGIGLAYQNNKNIISLSVDTWGVDYGYINTDGNLLENPHHYRDKRMGRHCSKFETLLQPYEQFCLTGNQPSLINTSYQLYADIQERQEIISQIKHILMIPDLIHYLLTGQAVAEATILSTSALLQAGKIAVSETIFKHIGLSKSLLPTIIPAGTVIGSLLPEIFTELENVSLKVIAGASHDTASAIASIPYRDKVSAAFISCGTWSLVGRETQFPVLTEEAFQNGFTNEGCYGGGNRLLKNINGLWLLQESQRYWAEQGYQLSHADIAQSAEAHGSTLMRINPNDELFFTPGPIPELICSYCLKKYGYAPTSRGEIARIIIESLADAYAEAIAELENLSATPIRTIHMVGGGIQNKLLCRLTAKATGRLVIAGPVEASALGNLLIQLTVLNKINEAARADVIAESCQLDEYMP